MPNLTNTEILSMIDKYLNEHSPIDSRWAQALIQLRQALTNQSSMQALLSENEMLEWDNAALRAEIDRRDGLKEHMRLFDKAYPGAREVSG